MSRRSKPSKSKSSGKGASSSGPNAAAMAEAQRWLDSLSITDVIKADVFNTTTLNQIHTDFHSHTPFPAYRISNFLDRDFALQLSEELKTIDYYRKNNDLYDFIQSQDLKSYSSNEKPLISKFRTFLYSDEFLKSLSTISGAPLVGLVKEVSMSGNVYQDTHTLLCHDDDVDYDSSEGVANPRRLAYILYLCEDWTAEEGGQLDLFDVDPMTKQPKDIVKSFVPEFNSLVFFQVSDVSYHQVREVIAAEGRSRLSITGWFHSHEPGQRPKPFIEPPLQYRPLKPATAAVAASNDGSNNTTNTPVLSLLDELTNRDYRRPNQMKKIKSSFADESAITLADFLKKEFYTQLMRELRQLDAAAASAASSSASSSGFQWHLTGPVNRRRYYSLPTDFLTSTTTSSTIYPHLHQLLRLFDSVEFGQYLSQLTGLTLNEVTGNMNKYTSSCYTMANDGDRDKYSTCLDVYYFSIDGKWNATVAGGGVHWIEEGNDEELMSVDPKENTLAIVYRTGEKPDEKEKEDSGVGIMKFVKYLNHYADQPMFLMEYQYRGPEDENDQDDQDQEENEAEEEEKAPSSKKAKSQQQQQPQTAMEKKAAAKRRR